MTYGTWHYSGEQYTDTVTLGSLIIQNQGISVANQSSGFPDDIDGVLGYVHSVCEQYRIAAYPFPSSGLVPPG